MPLKLYFVAWEIEILSPALMQFELVKESHYTIPAKKSQVFQI